MKNKFKQIWGERKENIMVVLAFIVLAGVMLMPLRIKRDAEKNDPMETTSENIIKAKSFDYKGHQYILFEETRALGASSFLHNPDCKKCKLTQ